MTAVDDMFAAAREIAEIIVARRRARRKALLDAANARRRSRYAARKAAGTLPAKLAPAPVQIDDCYDLDNEPGCRCATVAMAPCGWCEEGGTYDDDGNPVDGPAPTEAVAR